MKPIKLLFGLVLMFLLVMSSAFAFTSVQSPEVPLVAGSSSSAKAGVLINLTDLGGEVNITAVGKSSLSGSTGSEVFHASNYSSLGTCTYTGNTCTFASPIELNTSLAYRVENTGTSRTLAISDGSPSFPYFDSIVNFVNASIGGSNSTSFYYEVANITVSHSIPLYFQIRAQAQLPSATLDEFKANLSIVNETYGLLDYSGYGNDLTNNGAVYNTSVAGFEFENNDYLTADSTSIITSSDEITLAIWVNLKSTSSQDSFARIVDKVNGGTINNNGFRILRSTSSQIGAEIYDGTSTETVGLTSWNDISNTPSLLLLRVKSDEASFYVNNIEAGNESDTFFVNNSLSLDFGGTSRVSQFMDGTIYQVQYYNSYLNNSQAAEIYDRGYNGSPVDFDNLVTYYPFYQPPITYRTTSGNITFSELNDQSGNNNTLTNNGAVYNNSKFNTTSSNLEITDVSSFSSTNPFTLLSFIKTEVNTSSAQFIVSSGGSGGEALEYFLKDNKLTIYTNTNRAGNTFLAPNVTYCVAYRYDGADSDLFVNGQQDRSTVTFSNRGTLNTNIFIGEKRTGGDNFQGDISNVAIYNTNLSQSQIQSYCDNLGAVIFDDLNAYYPFNRIDENTNVNFTVYKDNYLVSQSQTGYNTSNNPFTAQLSESQISLSAQSVITNATVSPANFTIEGQTFTDGETINITAGDYNVTFSKTGWYNKTQQITVLPDASQSFTITDVFNSQVNVTFRGFLENNTKTNASGTYESTSLGYSANFDATPNTWVTFNWIKDQPVNITVDNELYALQTNETTPNSQSFNYTFYLYDTNSFFITIKDEVTQQTITSTNFTVEFISTASAFERTTTNGTIYASLLTPTDYELRYYSTNSVDYPLRSAFYTITNQTFSNITLYTLNESNTNVSQATITFRVLNADFQPVENAKIVVQRYYLSENGYISVFERFTNTNGEAVGTFETIDAFYKYQIYFNDVLKYSSPDAGTQFSTDENIIKYIDTTTVESDIIYDIQNIAHTLIFVPQTNTTGYFQLNYTNPSLYNICLTVSSLSGENQTCQATTSGSIQLSVTGSNTTNIAFTAVASALSDTLGTYQAFGSLIKTYTATALNSEDVRNSATFIFILLQISLTLALIRWPIWALITQTTMFIAIISIPYQLVSLTLASGSYFIAIVFIAIFLIKSRGAR